MSDESYENATPASEEKHEPVQKKHKWRSEIIDPVGSVDSLPISDITEDITEEEFQKLCRSIANNGDLDSKTREAMIKTLAAARRRLVTGSIGANLLNHEDTLQYHEHEGKYHSSAPIQVSAQGGRVSGAALLDFVAGTLKLGVKRRAMLVNSGFSVKLGIFKPIEVLGLIISLNDNRYEVGYRTKGAENSVDDVNLVAEIVEFILKKVEDCTIKDWTIEMIKQMLCVDDIRHLQANALAGMYPSGYPHGHICKNYGNGCNYNSVSLVENIDQLPRLDFKNVMYYANRNVYKHAMDLCAAPWGSIEYKKVVEYQKEKRDTRYQTPPLNDHGDAIYSLVIDFPNYMEYLEKGAQWVNAVEQMVNQAMEGQDHLDRKQWRQKRVRNINDTLDSLGSKKHIAWIKKIIVEVPGSDPMVIEGENDIASTIELIAGDDLIKKAIHAEINKFKNEHAVSLTGLQVWECPDCGANQKPDNYKPHLYPINMNAYFFDIMALRTIKLK